MEKELENEMRKNENEKEADKKRIERKLNKKNLTKTALIIAIFFLVCNTSEFIWWMSKIAQGSSFNPPPMFTFWGDFSQTLNSSCNIIIYGVMSKRFRDTYFENFSFLFCNKKRTNTTNQTPLNIVKPNKATKSTGNQSNLNATADSTAIRDYDNQMESV